ncbi:MAG: hypothetical protein ACXWM7_05130, partial [Parachlamydiaceae bacterium]
MSVQQLVGPNVNQLKAPAINSFIQRVSQLVDDKLTTNQQIQAMTPHIFRQPPEGVCHHKDIKEGLGIISALPSDSQAVVLMQANGMEAWIVQKIYCTDEAVRTYAALALNALNVSYFFRDPSEVLVRHIFKELTLNSTPEEIDELLSHYRKQQELVDQAKSFLQLAAEKAAIVVTEILKFFTIPLALYAAYLTWVHAKAIMNTFQIEYLPRVANLAINHVSVEIIRVGNKLYDLASTIQKYYFTILIATFVVYFTRLSQYRIVRISINCLYEIATLPKRIAGLPFDTARYVYSQFKSGTQRLIHSMSQGTNFWQAVRLQYELQQAENLWVSQVMQ